MIRVGIIGCGKIAQVRHLPEYAANPNAQVVAYHDKNRARVRLPFTRIMIKRSRLSLA